MGTLSGRTFGSCGGEQQRAVSLMLNILRNDIELLDFFLRLGFGMCFLLLTVILCSHLSLLRSSKEGATVRWRREDLLRGLQEFVPVHNKRHNAFATSAAD